MRGSAGGASPPSYLAIHNSEISVAYQRMEGGLAQLVLFQGSSSQLHQLPPISTEPKVLSKAYAASPSGKAKLRIWQAYNAFRGALATQMPCSKILPGFDSPFKIPLGVLSSLKTDWSSSEKVDDYITSLSTCLQCNVDHITCMTAPGLFIFFIRWISSRVELTSSTSVSLMLATSPPPPN